MLHIKNKSDFQCNQVQSPEMPLIEEYQNEAEKYGISSAYLKGLPHVLCDCPKFQHPQTRVLFFLP